MPLSFDPNTDIFADHAEIAINTVNCVGIMGAGIAKAVATRFPSALDHYVVACGKGLDCAGEPDRRYNGSKSSPLPPCIEAGTHDCAIHTVRPGHPLFSRTGLPTGSGPQWVLHLPTKRHWRDPSRLEDVEAGLRSIGQGLTTAARAWTIHMPPPGCGNGGLNWKDVRPLIQLHLGNPENAHHTIRCRGT